MALKKPSDYFKKSSTVDKTIQQVIKQPEVNTFSDAFEAFKSNLTKIETLSNFTETLDNYRVNIERVNHLSSKVEELQTEIQNTLKKEDLNQALMAQLLVVEESIQEVQNKVKGINQETLTEIKSNVSQLTDSVYEFLEVEVPKYKNLIVDSELRTDNRFITFETSVNETLEGIGEFVDHKYQELTENLQGINESSLISILEDFKLLETQLQQLKEEDIPRYKGFIVETERKTESKLNEYDEKLSSTLSTVDNSISNVLEKLNSVELDKTELINEVTQRINDVRALSSQVAEELKNNEVYKGQIQEKITDLETNIVIYDKHLKSYSKELNEKVIDLENNILLNEKNLKSYTQNLEQIQEQAQETLSRINLEEIEKQNYDLGKKVRYLEEVFTKFNEKEILTENLVPQPSSTETKDPLTPLNQNFVTLEQLQQHYRLFINRIQQQLSTLGGGGETRLKYLDDIVGIATNPSIYDGKFLKYNHSIQKFEFETVTQGGGSGGGGESYWVQSGVGIVTSSNVGIGTTNPTSKLSVIGDGIFSGVVTATTFIGNLTGTATYADNVGISSYADFAGIATYASIAGIATYAISAGISTYSTNAGIATYATNAGIATYANTAGIATLAQGLTGTPNIVVGIITASNIIGTLSGIATLAQGLTGTPNIVVGIATATTFIGNLTGTATTSIDVIGGIGSITSLTVSGVTTTTRLNVGTGGTVLTTTQSGNVGIGTTNPQYKLDVVGNAQVTGTLFVGDIISRGTSTEEIVRTSSGILTTVNTNPITIDAFSINSFRSAKYLVQVTTTSSLGIGTTTSVKNLSGGNDYFPGVYTNKTLISSTGVGTGARATITVSPKFTLTPTSCIGGTFTISGTTAGIDTGQTIYFNEELPILALEESKLTAIQLNSSGFGYTSIPSITVQSPIIVSNPVSGVGTGVTATASVTSMNVQNFAIAVGIATTAYPTVTFSDPSVGTTATGIVGVGVSTISVVNAGSGYTVSPAVSISKVTGFSGSVGLGISTLNWITSGGSGFTTTPTITITGQGGIGIGASIEADVDPNSPNGLINFRITNVGSGYTAVPTVAITGDGVGAGVTITRMVVTNVNVNNSGSGSTSVISNSDIVFNSVGGIGTGAVATVSSIIPTNVVMTNVGSGYTASNIPVTATFSDPSITATVGLGVETISLVTTGIGYTVLPTISFSSPTLGIGSTATASSTKLGYDLTTLFPGPGIGATASVYYIQPLSNNTFGISQTKNGSLIQLGYSVRSTTRVSVGGTVTQVNVTEPGSGYASNDIITAVNFDTTRPDVNVGVGFSFLVNNTVNNFQVSDLLLLQTADLGNPASYVVENAGIADVIDLGDFSSDISGGNSRLRFTPKFSFNTIKFYRTAFTI